MSGHSKWSSIKHKKGAADAARGKVFTRHAKLIEIAAREGGSGDPAMNAALKAAVDNAKAENVPNANIDRSIKKGTGELKGEATVAVTYEAYGPGGAAFIIEALTDNTNRTLNNVRAIITKNGGKWAESGAVAYMFERKGVVVGAMESGKQEARSGNIEELELQLIDLGAEDIDESDDDITVTSDATSWAKIRDALKDAGYEIVTAGLKYVAGQKVDVTDGETAQKVMDFIEKLEEDEDVSDVHTNADISDELAASIS